METLFNNFIKRISLHFSLSKIADVKKYTIHITFRINIHFQIRQRINYIESFNGHSLSGFRVFSFFFFYKTKKFNSFCELEHDFAWP